MTEGILLKGTVIYTHKIIKFYWIKVHSLFVYVFMCRLSFYSILEILRNDCPDRESTFMFIKSFMSRILRCLVQHIWAMCQECQLLSRNNNAVQCFILMVHLKRKIWVTLIKVKLLKPRKLGLSIYVLAQLENAHIQLYLIDSERKPISCRQSTEWPRLCIRSCVATSEADFLY